MKRDAGIEPELEFFELGMVNFAKALVREGLLDPPCYFSLLMGDGIRLLRLRPLTAREVRTRLGLARPLQAATQEAVP